MKSVGGEKSQ